MTHDIQQELLKLNDPGSHSRAGFPPPVRIERRVLGGTNGD